MQPALVSIITPSFNSAKFIAETIRSVIKQTYANWELIVVDDGSTDETAEIVSAFSASDARIKFYPQPRNLGAGVARHLAVSKATGNYIAFLDADDLWYPDKLQEQLEWMAHCKQPFTFSFYDCINEHGVYVGKRIEAPLKLTYRQLFFCNYVGNLTGIYSVDYFGKLDIHGIRKRQDWMMWLTILKNVKKAYPVAEPLAAYRMRSGSISSSKVSLLKYNYAVYRKHHKLNTILALGCMVVFIAVQLLIKPTYTKKTTSPN